MAFARASNAPRIAPANNAAITDAVAHAVTVVRAPHVTQAGNANSYASLNAKAKSAVTMVAVGHAEIALPTNTAVMKAFALVASLAVRVSTAGLVYADSSAVTVLLESSASIINVL